MSIAKRYDEARRVLEAPPDASARDLKRAYRRKIAAYPPDRDPDGFRRVRDAYELLREPVKRGLKLLLDPTPTVPVPVVELDAERGGSAGVELLRDFASQISTDALLGDEAPSSEEQGR